ncbi:MAG: hypothetical protein KBI47_08855, partial [Armatimonadetes bacterium]|nr:hypothetical protein [Armatimonadota bacterium]
AEQGQTKEVGALGEQVKLKVTIRADHADLTLTSDQWVSNLARTQEFISGRRVRGVFAAMFYGTRHATAPKSPDAARRLFFSDETRFGDCCIVQDALPVLPMPLSTFYCKHHPPGSEREHGALVDALRGEPPEACAECGAPMERASGWRRRSGYWFGASCRERTSTALKDGTADEGRLFTREGIAQETVLSGEIVTTLELWDEFVAGTGMRLGEDIDIVLGSSCPAIMRVEMMEDSPQAVGVQPPQGNGAGGEVTVTFLSDVLIDDELGEPVTVLDDKGLLGALGLNGIQGVSVAARFQATTRVSGWNAAWGLPMGQRPGIAAGSCFLLSILTDDLEGPMRLLQAAEKKGIGVRCNEGFGRIRVNDPFHNTAQGVSTDG